ncbi:zinc finger protein 469 [Nannospalax galili]|uniref:zinc finger protein 469 n=1 Tax=Nannospalax galili TaxID=1026970 RepID=UPI00081A085C|nr:zinc finger protein 469 [Nannospalax galili]XP_029422976.1 zinc finger protein 469 [Nannospalax galili]XP_029422977.1 zinc finger protein 469 [Nannospalax galili]XP_029422978.1 zinc finger protein 469 [Nannospalax galili]
MPLHSPSTWDSGAMPGEWAPSLPRDMQPCQVASGLGYTSQHPLKDHTQASRTTQGMREEGNEAQAREPLEAQLKQAKEVEPTDLLLRTQALSGHPGKGSSPQVPPGQSREQTHSWLAGRMESSPPQLHGLSISRVTRVLDEPPRGLQCEAPQPPETEAPQSQRTRACHRPRLPRAEAPPSPEENGSQRCFQETPSSFTSTNCTSPSTIPGPLPLRGPQNSSASPHRPASGPDRQAIGANPWPPAAENNFPGANFGVPSAEPKPFPESSRPSSRQGVPIPYPFPSDTVQHEQAAGAVVFTFHQPLAAWSEEALGTSSTYPPLPCPRGQLEDHSASSDLGGALSPSGAAHLAPSPFHDSVHKSLTKVLPEEPPPTHNGLGSPRGPPNPPTQRHFPRQGYRTSGVGTSPGPLDTELPTPGPPPTHLPQLWDPTAAPYSTSTLGPTVATRTAFFKGQQLCLPQSPPLPWSPVLMTPGPNPHRMGVLSRLPFPRGLSECQGDSQGDLGTLNTMRGPGETLSALRSSPGQPNSSPRLLAYGGLKDPGTQSLFFGGAQPQASPRGAPNLPPPRVTGASPSESPLPSPATNTASSTTSSLSPPSSSPANPSSEDSQQPGAFGPSSFFLPSTHSQETSSPFPSPEPPHTLPTHYQREPAKAFPLSTEGLGAKDAFEGLEGAPFPCQSPSVSRGGLRPFPAEPPPYSTQHFSLSSASLDQLDVLLTCRQCDRNYSSLAAFLEHRPFCSLLLARNKDGPLQPPGLPTPSATPKAPTDAHSGLLEHSQAPFLLARDDRGDSKDDSLRTGFLPSLATTPFPLPTSDLDMEDDAKLDRLITEALNGMEYQSDNPEIDSSFIDVFADEEPVGSRGPSAGQPPNTHSGATPKNGTQSLLPTRAACTEDRVCLARNRPKTRSLGPASTETEAASLVRQQRRGKQFKLFQKELDVTKGVKSPVRAICLRPRRRGHSTERPPPQGRRSQTRRGRADTDESIPRATSTETRSSKRLRLTPGKDPRRRRTPGGSWNKELIHKIVQQKNRRYRRQTPRSQVLHNPLLTARPPSAQEIRLKGRGCVSESEEEDGAQQQGPGDPGSQGRSRYSRQRWRRGRKRKEKDLDQGPRKVRKQEAGENRGLPTPGGAHSLMQSLDSEDPVERDPECAGHPTEAPKHPPQVTTTTKTPEENHTALGFPPEAKKPEVAAELPPNTTEHREKSSSSATCGGESPRCPPPETLQPHRPRPSGSHPDILSGEIMPTPHVGCLLGTSRCLKAPRFHTGEDISASQPGGCLVPTDNATDAVYTKPSILVFKNSDPGCDPDHYDRDSIGCPAAQRGPPPNSDTPCELLLGPKDLAGCFPEDLYSKPLAVDTPHARCCYFVQDCVETLKSRQPKNPPYPTETDPSKAHLPLALESTSLFSELPNDGFDPQLYNSLSANRGTQVPLVCTDPLPKKPQADPLYRSFLLLEEVSPVLPGPFPGLSKDAGDIQHSVGTEHSASSKKSPFEARVSPSPPPVPEKGNECSVTFMSNLCEDELEIKRLVSELESQLQRRGSTRGPPGEADRATGVSRMDPGPESASLLPKPQSVSPHGGTLSTASLSGPQQEGALRSSHGQWPCLASRHTGEAAPPPGTQLEDPSSEAAFSPTGFRLSFPAVQEASASNVDPEIPLGDHLPVTTKQQGPLLHAGSLAKCSPNRKLVFPKNNEASGTQKEGAPLLRPCEHLRGRSLDSHETQRPCPSSSALEALGSPSTHLALAPNLVLQGDKGAVSPPGARPRHVSQEHLEGQAEGSMGAVLTHPIAEGLGFEGESASAGTFSLPTLQGGRAWSHPMLGPAWVPSDHLGQKPQDPACHSCPPLQVLGAGAKSEDEAQGQQELLPNHAQSPRPGDPSVTGGAGMKGGPSGAVKMSTVPTDTGHQLRPKADGHLGSPSQAKKTKGQGQASWLQSNNRKSLGGPDMLTKVRSHPEARPARARRAYQGSRAVRGLRAQIRPSISPTRPDGASLVSTLTAAQLQMGPTERSPEKATSLHQVPQLLVNRESPAPTNRGLATHVPSPISLATPTSCGLEPPPREDPRGLPAPLSCSDPSSPQHQPTCPASVLLGRASHVQVPKDAGSERLLAAPPSLVTSHCGPKETLSYPSNPKDPPSSPSGPITVSSPSRHGKDGPRGSTIRTLEDSGKEAPRKSPACATAPPPGGPSFPRMTSEVAPISSIPTKDGLDSSRELGVTNPDSMEALSPNSPEKISSKDSSSGPQRKIPCPSHRKGHSIMAMSTDPAMLEAPEPDSHTCLDGETGANSEGQRNPGTPGARHSDVTKVPRAGARGIPTGLQLAQTASWSCTASDFRSDSPQIHVGVPYHPPQKDPLGLQDPKRRPCKKLEPTEKPPAGPPVTCELCSASFRSRAGLNLHKARKHRRHGEASSQLNPMALPAHQPPESTAQTPGKERPSPSPLGPSRASRPPPIQGSTAPEDTLGPEKATRRESGEAGIPDAPLNQQPHTPGLIKQGKGARVTASKSERPDQLHSDQLHPSQTETRVQRGGGGPVDSPSRSERKPNRKAGKPRLRRQKHSPENPAGMTSDRHPSDLSTALGHPATPLSLSTEGEHRADVEPPGGPGSLEGTVDMAPETLYTEETPTQKAPQEWRVHRGRIEREQPVEKKTALEWWFREPGETRALDIGKETSWDAESQPAEHSRGAQGRSDEGTGEGTPDSPNNTPSSEVGSTISTCPKDPMNDPETKGGDQGSKETTPEAPSPGQRDPPGLFDDELSFSQLFPLGGRLAQKKNQRVYGKRCKGPKCPPPTEPSIEATDSASLFSTRLPTDLSDSGSLCLSREEEDLWDDEAMGLPESFLLDGLLSSKAPGLDPWTPSLSLWALEPSTEASCAEEELSCCTEGPDEWSEAIPQLHMVPAAWRGLELCAPTCETSSSLGDMSPEPPNLERERDEGGFPRNINLPPLHVKDFEVLSTQLEMQDLCLLGPCDDPTSFPSPSILDFKATVNSQGPQSKRTEETARAGRAKGRDGPKKGRRASYKCRVCFQLFHGLGELDLHKLAHSPSPPPTCYMCVERRFGSRELLREHLWERHVQGRAGPWACGMCLKEVADIWMYNQHLREHAARFARNGQARRTLEDLPGCLEGDNTLTHFLNNIVEQASKPQRGRCSVGKAKGSEVTSEREKEAGKEISKGRVKPKVRVSATSSRDGAFEPPGGSTKGGSLSTLTSGSVTCSGSVKTSPTPSPDPWPHSESLLQAVPVHEDCKDPSRDCHHCGKQFPKPFKLQRHLAVHSPQRVYLCPRCPRVYPEHWELQVHLGVAHEVKEEREVPHTPLYTCELCANVMHVIRRSFVCSSCNYTFAKKEQFDRHMDKHLRSGQQPFALRSVRRPGLPRRKTPVPEDVLPSKRPRVVVPSCPSNMDRAPSMGSPTPSEGSLPTLPLLCPEATPSPTQDQSSSQERPVDQAGHPHRGDDPPLNSQDLSPPSLSPFPAASAEGAGGCELDRALERPENKALSGSPEPCKHQTPPEEKKVPHLFSGKLRSPGSRGKCAPGCSTREPSLPQKERPMSTHRMVPEGKMGGPSQKSSATKSGACWSSSKHRSAVPTPGKAPKLPVPPRKPTEVGSPACGELARSPEDRVKPSTPKAKPRPSSQGSGGSQHGTQTWGGSQPQPTSGQLQSEMATTPAEPSYLGWQSPTPNQLPPRAKGSTRGPRGTDDQETQVHVDPRDKREDNEKRKRGLAPRLVMHESTGDTGRAPSGPHKPSRAPRKQATPSRVPPAKPRPSGQSSRTRPQPAAQRKGDPSHTPEKGSFPQARPLLRPYKRGRAVHGAEPMEPRDHRTVEAQNDLLSQLFGQKLTSFKIPLKKDTSQ